MTKPQPQTGLLYVGTSLIYNRFVILQLARRAILGRYRGSMLGMLWSLFTPLLMLAIYTFVFGTVLKMRWATQEGGTLEFAAFLFSGMIVHGVLAECLNQSATLISGNPQYVKKIVFPLEVLPWVTVISAFFQALISLFVLVGYQFIVEGSIPWTALLLPLPFAALALVCVGVGWFVSAAAVYFKDIAQVAGILTTVLFFMAPILYPKSMLPQTFQPLLYINPITFVIEQVRDLLLLGSSPNWGWLLIYFGCALLFARVALGWFQRTRQGFADVL